MNIDTPLEASRIGTAIVQALEHGFIRGRRLRRLFKRMEADAATPEQKVIAIDARAAIELLQRANGYK